MIEVSGERVDAPLLDTRRTAPGQTVTLTELQRIPTARDPWAVVSSTPGVLADRINVGSNESGQQAVWSIDGVVITDMEAIDSSPAYYEFDSFEEMQTCVRVIDAATSHRVKAEMLMKAGNLEGAEAEYVLALAYNPTDEEAWRGLEALGRIAGFKVNRRAMGAPCADGAAFPDLETVTRFIREVVIVR